MYFFFFLLIHRKRKFCAEPMRERLTFHFELRTRSGNFRFFFLFFFSPFFLFFQIKARSHLVTIISKVILLRPHSVVAHVRYKRSSIKSGQISLARRQPRTREKSDYPLVVLRPKANQQQLSTRTVWDTHFF